jgi:hypothetical protein
MTARPQPSSAPAIGRSALSDKAGGKESRREAALALAATLY